MFDLPKYGDLIKTYINTYQHVSTHVSKNAYLYDCKGMNIYLPSFPHHFPAILIGLR